LSFDQKSSAINAIASIAEDWGSRVG